MTKLKNVFLLAAMAVSAVFVACEKEDDNFTFKDTTLKLTANDGGTTIITFISATEFRASGSETKTGTYTFVEQTLTLTFSDGTIPPIILTKEGDTFTSADYTVTTGNSDGNTGAWNGMLTATNVEDAPDNATVDAVKAMTLNSSQDGYEELVSAPYANGSFMLQLPEIVPAQYLKKLDFSEGATVSDATAKAVEFGEITAYKGETTVGDFYYGYESDDFVVWAIFMYVDKDVSITGSSVRDNEVKTYRMSLKRGWNKVYVKASKSEPATEEFTTTEPSGLKWIFKLAIDIDIPYDSN